MAGKRVPAKKPRPYGKGVNTQMGAGSRFSRKGHAGPPVMGGQPPSPDYFGQLNQFQADISGEQPGALGAGWGGAGGDLGTMGMTKVNSWLNTFTDPVERAKAMNGIGYFNQGNPYDPASARGGGMNRFARGNAQQNMMTGGMSAPGTYLTQSGGYGAGPGEMPNLNFGGYLGATQVGGDLSAQYSPFAPKSTIGKRRRRSLYAPS